MFSLGLSRHVLRALRARRAREGCSEGTPGADWRRSSIVSPMELDHETGMVPLSGVRGVVPSTSRAGARVSASLKSNAPSISQMSRRVGRCHVERSPRRETSLIGSSFETEFVDYIYTAPRIICILTYVIIRYY